MKQKVGEKIRKLRKNKKMRLKDLAKKSRLAISTMCDIEKGRSNPSLESLERIAEALEVSTAFLMANNYANNVNNDATGTEGQ